MFYHEDCTERDKHKKTRCNTSNTSVTRHRQDIIIRIIRIIRYSILVLQYNTTVQYYSTAQQYVISFAGSRGTPTLFAVLKMKGLFWFGR